MNPAGFFLLTVLLVLVTETASRKTREKFSQASDDNIDLKALGGSGGSSSSHDEYSRSESSWNSFKSKSPKAVISSEEVYEERKHKQRSGDSSDDRAGESSGEMEHFLRRKEKQRFGQEINK
ncbi:seminal vesicle secretory protein 6-like [Peromyscus californicus insignis]|uniref:seminal vesicle secretory protein 6-like n=1 Tax=Peromyscus californicus insignis TaxID=564181 RepID=UPI0022A768F6|nr:seminal vesicle secretory protein 6-like [Peromyscus californicus insignis]